MRSALPSWAIVGVLLVLYFVDVVFGGKGQASRGE